MLYLQNIVNVMCNQESRLAFPLEGWVSGFQEPFTVLDTGIAIGLVASRSGSALTWRTARTHPAGASVAAVSLTNVQVGTDLFSYSSSHTGKCYSWSHTVDSFLFKILPNPLAALYIRQAIVSINSPCYLCSKHKSGEQGRGDTVNK